MYNPWRWQIARAKVAVCDHFFAEFAVKKYGVKNLIFEPVDKCEPLCRDDPRRWRTSRNYRYNWIVICGNDADVCKGGTCYCEKNVLGWREHEWRLLKTVWAQRPHDASIVIMIRPLLASRFFGKSFCCVSSDELGSNHRDSKKCARLPLQIARIYGAGSSRFVGKTFRQVSSFFPSLTW